MQICPFYSGRWPSLSYFASSLLEISARRSGPFRGLGWQAGQTCGIYGASSRETLNGRIDSCMKFMARGHVEIRQVDAKWLTGYLQGPLSATGQTDTASRTRPQPRSSTATARNLPSHHGTRAGLARARGPCSPTKTSSATHTTEVCSSPPTP